MTLHRTVDGGILLTHRSTQKPPSVWDERRVEAARHAGYAEPERHGDYYQNRPLVAASNVAGYHLVGKRVDIEAASARAKYDGTPGVTLVAPAREFMLHILLTTPGQVLPATEPAIHTPFGDLYFGLALR